MTTCNILSCFFTFELDFKSRFVCRLLLIFGRLLAANVHLVSEGRCWRLRSRRTGSMLHVAGKYNTFNCRSFAAAVARLLHSVPPRDRLCQPGVISRGTRENAVPIVIVFNHALLTALRTIFRPKTLYIAGFCTYNLNFFFWGGIILPGPYRSAPGAWTQTPISAWLASVPIVPVLRNDH